MTFSAPRPAPVGELYCDYNASAPLRPLAREAMLECVADPANASSGHAAGRRAAERVRAARASVGSLIGARPGEMVFTSGATEANNLALHAMVAARPDSTVLVSAVEHPAVLQAARARARAQFTVIGVDANGQLDLGQLRRCLSQTSAPIVSIMAANNETGVVNDMAFIADLVHARGGWLHCDGTQAVGRVPMDVTDAGIDLLSLSAHKFGGVQGVGALYIARDVSLDVTPLAFGGSHERGWRSGTLNVPGIVAAGAAAAEAAEHMDGEIAASSGARDSFEAIVHAELPETAVIGARAARLPGTSSLLLPGTPADAVLAAMPDVCASDGSACAFGAPHPSHVLLAMGLSSQEADCVVRFSFGYGSTPEQGRQAGKRLLDAQRHVRAAMSSAVGEAADGAHTLANADSGTPVRMGTR